MEGIVLTIRYEIFGYHNFDRLILNWSNHREQLLVLLESGEPKYVQITATGVTKDRILFTGATMKSIRFLGMYNPKTMLGGFYLTDDRLNFRFQSENIVDVFIKYGLLKTRK